ncbi:outer membrane protein assembly factor BamC [Methylomonas fluvii]|uniref:Outer membrane protein assembly factor BamC n=1 Tax=Methylomonas fluvii TaxID=1854564 RepID=A0ABR9D8M3_9GAMM|nr:outer membrane protein assembly factor BamC [Methylomonas fluvii]MBD9359457.1 outer membrane protein assembly factor BamC [Methylomonas fluvii]
MLLRTLTYSLPCLLLVACADAPDKYRDTHHLELPPVLPIEHTNPQPALAVDDLKPKSALADLMAFTDDAGKPVLTLNTRPDRAWEMVATALKISNIEVLDKSQEDQRFQVRYDPDTSGKDVGLLRALLNNDYDEAEYTIKLKEERRGLTVNASLTKPEDLEFGEDGSAELIRLLHKAIDEKIINRPPDKKADE